TFQREAHRLRAGLRMRAFTAPVTRCFGTSTKRPMDTRTGSELGRYRRCLGMRVSQQHPGVSVAADGSDFWHVLPPRDADHGTATRRPQLVALGAPTQA